MCVGVGGGRGGGGGGGDRGAMGLTKTAAADASITFLWVFCMASLGAVSTALAPHLGMDGPGNGRLYIVFGLVSFLIFLFSALAQALGGASWNPTALVAFAYAGVSKDNLFSLGVRLPAQVSPTPQSYHFYVMMRWCNFCSVWEQFAMGSRCFPLWCACLI